MVPAPVQIVLGLGAGYLTATVSESALHRHVGHATSRRRRRWAANPRVFASLTRSHFRHAIVHHGLTFRSDHVTQFDDEEQRREVHRRARAAGVGRLEATGYGLRPGWLGFVTYNLTTVPVLAILARVVGPWSAVAAAPLLAIAPALSRWVHPFLHRGHAAALREAPRPVAFLLRTRYFRAVARHHFLHHKYPDSNFNLLLGGDWLLGIHRRASPADREEMEAIGLRLD